MVLISQIGVALLIDCNISIKCISWYIFVTPKLPGFMSYWAMERGSSRRRRNIVIPFKGRLLKIQSTFLSQNSQERNGYRDPTRFWRMWNAFANCKHTVFQLLQRPSYPVDWQVVRFKVYPELLTSCCIANLLFLNCSIWSLSSTCFKTNLQKNLMIRYSPHFGWWWPIELFSETRLTQAENRRKVANNCELSVQAKGY